MRFWKRVPPTPTGGPVHYDSPWRRDTGSGHPHQLLIADIDEKRNYSKEEAEQHERKAAFYRKSEAEHQHAMDALIASWPGGAS